MCSFYFDLKTKPVTWKVLEGQVMAECSSSLNTEMDWRSWRVNAVLRLQGLPVQFLIRPALNKEIILFVGKVSNK